MKTTIQTQPEARWLGTIGYPEALRLQDERVEAVHRKDAGEIIFLLEHEGVYTIGRSRDQTSLRQQASLPFPVVQSNRGGLATYHGPGQLVCYPILDLKARGPDLHRYLRLLEQVIIDLLDGLGIHAHRRDGLTGVWVEDRKIASLGVGVRKWVTMHGFALNATADALSPFDAIIPCGIQNVQMTSIESEAGKSPSIKELADQVTRLLLDRLRSDMPRDL